MKLCQYKDIFGKPNDGVHSKRIFGLASIDLILTILIGTILGLVLNFKPLYILALILCLILLGIIAHRIFCVNTTLNKLIFGTV